jgi:hypothetical protein
MMDEEHFMEHRDKEIRQKILELCDTLCTYERMSGCESTLIIVDTCGFFFGADSGKPVPLKELLPWIECKVQETKGDV